MLGNGSGKDEQTVVMFFTCQYGYIQMWCKHRQVYISTKIKGFFGIFGSTLPAEAPRADEAAIGIGTPTAEGEAAAAPAAATCPCLMGRHSRNSSKQ